MSLGFEIFTNTTAYTNSDVSSGSLNLTTSGTDRIVLCCVHTVGTSGARRSVTGVSGGTGMTWAKYTSFDFDSSDVNRKQRMEIWWAYAAAQQTSQPITVTLSGASHDLQILMGSVTGVPGGRLSNPFDQDPSLPLTWQNPSTTNANHVVSISTHDGHDVAFLFWGATIQASSNSPQTPSGWTNLITYNGGGADSVSVRSSLLCKVYSAQLIGQSLDFTNAGIQPTQEDGGIVFCVGGDPIAPVSKVCLAGF